MSTACSVASSSCASQKNRVWSNTLELHESEASLLSLKAMALLQVVVLGLGLGPELELVLVPQQPVPLLELVRMVQDQAASVFAVQAFDLWFSCACATATG